MATFNNKREVTNQVGHQHIYGDMNYYINDVSSAKRLGFDRDETDTYRNLDEKILSSLAFTEMTNRRRSIDIPHRQTCRWIFELEKYQSWRNRWSGLLWIKGKPGAGKSTLMSQLYSSIYIDSKQHASTSDDICLEFFFSARGALLERSALGMLRTLSNQIFRHDPCIRTLLRTSYQEIQTSFGDVSWEWKQAELEKLFSDMVLASSQERRVIIFVDALDEAGEAAEGIARYFHDLNSRIQTQSATAKICIACRHYPVPGVPAAVAIHVEDHNGEDIAAYIRDFVSDYIDINNSSSVAVSDREKWQKLMQDLAGMANGLFQWARLVMPLLKKRIHDGDSIDQIQNWLLRIPAELEQVYEYIFNNVIDQEHKMESFRLFQWVCLAIQPLSVTELRYALATHDIVIDALPQSMVHQHTDLCFVETDEIMKRRVVSRSGGLIEVVDSGKGNRSQHSRFVVQPIHLSVKTFLLTQGLSLLSRSSTNYDTPGLRVTHETDWSFSVIRAHGELYWSCLKYIVTDKVWSDPDGLSDYEDPWDMKFSETKERPFIEYAIKNVLVHAREAQNQRGQDLGQELQILERAIDSRARATYPRTSSRRKNAFSLAPLRPVQIYSDYTPLHIAAIADMTDLARHLLDHEFDMSFTDHLGYTALHLASQHGHLIMVKMLVGAGADMNATARSGGTPLYMAAMLENPSIFKWLSERGANLDPSGNGSASALNAAAESGNMEIIGLCIEAGASVSLENRGLEKALFTASVRNQKHAVQKLLEAGADVNTLVEVEGYIYNPDQRYSTALQEAAHVSATQIMQLLLEAGADVNAKGRDNGTALYEASQELSIEGVEMLLKAGANVNAEGGSYGTALSAAVGSVKPLLVPRAEGFHEKVVQMLIDAGANVNYQSEEHPPALQCAADKGNMQVVQALIKAGADVNAQGCHFGTALQAAGYGGHTRVLQLLLNEGAEVNAQGGTHGNALQAVASCNHGNVLSGDIEEIVQILLRAGADVNAKGGENGSALQAAARMRSTDRDRLVRILLDAGADPNVQGGEMGNALQAAASLAGRANEKVVQDLLDAGADVNAQGGPFGSALQAAAFVGDTKTAQILLSAGAEINRNGGEYDSALAAAASSRSENAEEMIQMLLSTGADIGIQGDKYGNALQAAARTHNTKVVQILLDQGANVNAEGGEYGNALQAATSPPLRRSRNVKDVVRKLLDAGANVNAQGGKYKTAMNAALQTGHRGLVKILIEAGADGHSDTYKIPTPSRPSSRWRTRHGS